VSAGAPLVFGVRALREDETSASDMTPERPDIAENDEAPRTPSESDVIRLSAAGQRAFAEALLDPPAPSPGLLEAFEMHARLIRETR
jgi:hypothetical protein